MGIEGTEFPFAAAQLDHLLVGADLIVDALIGYGLRGAPREPVASFVRAAERIAQRQPSPSIPRQAWTGTVDRQPGLPSRPQQR